MTDGVVLGVQAPVSVAPLVPLTFVELAALMDVPVIVAAAVPDPVMADDVPLTFEVVVSVAELLPTPTGRRRGGEGGGEEGDGGGDGGRERQGGGE